jgi:excisionase family DNA binding protein
MMPTNGTDQRDARQVESEAGAVADAITEVLDVGDVAEIFKCSREKIKRMARRGELPAFKFGKHWYLRKDDLEQYLSGRVQLNGHLRRIQEV